MRNWNIVISGYASATMAVFSVPMRNWKLPPDQEPEQETEFSAYLWGIETSPPPGVITSLRRFSAYLWGIETSAYSVTGCSGFFVFSVPMRNWNICFYYTTHVWYMSFSAYLWGIETTAVSFMFSHISLFSAYLWGIETNRLPVPKPLVYMFSAYLWGIETEADEWKT